MRTSDPIPRMVYLKVLFHEAKSVIWPLVTILTALATATTLFFAASMALQSTIRVTVLFIHRGFQMRMEEVVRVIYLGTSIGGAVRDDHFLFIFILHQITGFFVVAFVCLIFQSMPPTLRSRIERWWRACLDPLEQWWRTTSFRWRANATLQPGRIGLGSGANGTPQLERNPVLARKLH